ncbi:hypothetical protein M977_00743 [Buttiauxella gaviniae ATCC 51604]|uniref:DUF2971 domain-containing protein n=1 Tax=Buttiauxella gaviniae ATCC 51604 TaxID=1354253 RepID=A0A1B7I528_9ENTR|nr:DUF2971 domain-containing protein [Buttiauxella gaviniae]OAT23493.1 hypothetical protein M977_00743 [Buttiauxella gaviniae ATCC 51604]
MKIEKCTKFYKYVSIEGCLKIITEGTLKYTKPVDFNDPFDCYPYMPERGADKLFKRLATRVPITHHASKKKTQKNCALIKRTGSKGVIHEILSKSIAITCFSTDPFSVPMWAHYANNHEGCVIELQATDQIVGKIAQQSPNSPIILPIHVVYSDDRLPLCDKDGIINGFNPVFVKSTQWSYEKEVRAYCPNDGIQPFNRLQITKVFMGERITQSNKKAVEAAIDVMNKEIGSRCKTTSLTLAFKTFKFVEVQS